MRTLASEQTDAAGPDRTAIPETQVRWHYDVVLNGMAVVVPRSQLATLVIDSRRDGLAVRHLPLARRARRRRCSRRS